MSARALVRAFVTNWQTEYKWHESQVAVTLHSVPEVGKPSPVFAQAVLTVDRDMFKACGFDRLMKDRKVIKMTMEVEDE